MRGGGWVEPVAPEGSAAPQASPQDSPQREARQALRLKRYLMAASTSLLAAAALFIFHWLGLLPLKIERATVSTLYGELVLAGVESV